MVNRIAVSDKEKAQFKTLKLSNPNILKKTIYSFYPVDRHDCPCQKVIMEFNNRLGKLSLDEIGNLKYKTEYIRCPRDKTNMQQFRVHCGICGDLVGECYATDDTLKDYCDFHYISYYTVDEKEVEVEEKEEQMDKQGHSLSKFKTKKVKKKFEEGFWHGALGVNLSPIDGMIGIECCCGNDTRDFRANNTLIPELKKKKMEETSYGRDYGQKISRYKLVPIDN